MKKRVISLLLCAVLLVGVMPMGVFGVTAGAVTDPPTGEGYPSVFVGNWDDLKSALEYDGDLMITLTDDIHYYIGLSYHEYDSTSLYKCDILGNKVLELNGNDIYYEDDSNVYIYNINGTGKWTAEGCCETTLFRVEEGADLTIQDTEGGGKIHSGGYFVGYYKRYEMCTCTEYEPRVDMYWDECQRNLFEVKGNVTVKSGKIAAGKEKKQWLDTATVSDYGIGYGNVYTGYATLAIGGNAFTVKSGGKLTVFGGDISGTATHNTYSDSDGEVVQHISNSAVYAEEGSKVTIYDGSFTGYNGASALYGDYKDRVAYFDLSVYGGIFKTRKNDYNRITERRFVVIFGSMAAATKHTDVRVQYGKYGRILIPSSALKNPHTRLISHGVDVTDNGNYDNYLDVTVTCGNSGFSNVTAEKNVLCKNDFVFLISQNVEDIAYYPSDSAILTQRTKKEYRFRVTDLDDTSVKFDFTTSGSQNIDLLSYIDISQLTSGHRYRVSGTCVITYKGDPLDFTVSTTPAGTAKFTYSDAVFPDSSVFVSQNYIRNCASGIGTLDVYVTLSNLTSATKIELTSPFSGKKYSKLAESNGTYMFTLDESTLTFGSVKNYNITLTAVDTAGNTIYKDISTKYYSAPWMTSSKTAKYNAEKSVEKLLTGYSVTLKSNVSLPSGYTVQWYSAPVTNGSIGTASKISGATSANYTATYLSDTAYYFVVTETATGRTAYSNTVILNEDTDTYCADITASGNQASNTNPVTLTCNAYNYSGTLTYNWYIAEGPDGYYKSEISGISTEANRQSISFPSSKLLELKNTPAPGTYKIYCSVKDSGKGITYKTPAVTVTLDRNVESVTVTDRKNGYKYLDGINIYLPSETGTVALKTEVTPSNTNENYTVTYYGYDDDIIDVTPEGVIKGKKSGKTTLYARYYHENGVQITTFCWTVFVPISTVDIYLFGRPVVNEYPTYEAYLTDSNLSRDDHYWYDVDSNSHTSVQDKVVQVDKKYGYRIEMSLKQPYDYYFPVDSYTLEEYYHNKGKYGIDVTRVDYYINPNELEIRWHLDEDHPENYEIDSENQRVYYSQNQIISEYEFGRIYDKTKNYVNYLNYQFAVPDVGMTVTKDDIINAFSTDEDGFKIVSASNNQIYDKTTYTWIDGPATLEAGHTYMVYLVCATESYGYGQDSSGDKWRMADNFMLYVNGEPAELTSQHSQTAFLNFSFVPGGGTYITQERIGSLEYGAGKVAARFDSSKVNEQGISLNSYGELQGADNNSTCYISELYWESAEGINKFLADGTFKPNTEYTLVMNIQMNEDRPEDACYNLDTVAVTLKNDDGSESICNFNSDNGLEVINKVRTAIVKVPFANTGELIDHLTVSPTESSVKATDGYSSGWAILNNRTFTVKNDMLNDAEAVTVTYGETDIADVTADEYFVLTAPASTDLESGESTTFSVRLKTGLEAGTYTGYFNISWQNASSETVVQTVCLIADVTARETYSVSGNLTVFGDENEETRIVLTKQGESEPAYSISVEDGDTAYSIPGVAEGEYTMSVSKVGHATRNYALTVSGDVTQNVAIRLCGDMNGDGEILVDDYSAAVNAALASDSAVPENLSPDENYIKAVADFDCDGVVDVLDVVMVERIINKHI